MMVKEMAPACKSLPCKDKDLNLMPRIHMKKRDKACTLSSPALRR